MSHFGENSKNTVGQTGQGTGRREARRSFDRRAACCVWAGLQELNGHQQRGQQYGGGGEQLAHHRAPGPVLMAAAGM